MGLRQRGRACGCLPPGLFPRLRLLQAVSFLRPAARKGVGHGPASRTMKDISRQRCLLPLDAPQQGHTESGWLSAPGAPPEAHPPCPGAPSVLKHGCVIPAPLCPLAQPPAMGLCPHWDFLRPQSPALAWSCARSGCGVMDPCCKRALREQSVYPE